MRIFPVHTGPAQVVRDPMRVHALSQCLERTEVVEVERVGATDRQRHAVHYHRIRGSYTVEIVQCLTACNQVVLRQQLKPVDAAAAGQDLLVMRRAQPQAEAEGRGRQRGEHGWNAGAGSAGTFRFTGIEETIVSARTRRGARTSATPLTVDMSLMLAASLCWHRNCTVAFQACSYLYGVRFH